MKKHTCKFCGIETTQHGVSHCIHCGRMCADTVIMQHQRACKKKLEILDKIQADKLRDELESLKECSISGFLEKYGK